MKKYAFALATISLLSLSCSRDDDFEESDLFGTWVEAAPYSDTLVFQSDNTLLKTRDGVTDTLSFSFDEYTTVLTVNSPNSSSKSYDILMYYGFVNMVIEDYRYEAGESISSEFDRL